MIFAYRPTADCADMLLGHSVAISGKRLRKGHWLTAQDLSALVAAGIDQLFAGAREAEDVIEDDAALQLAQLVSGAHLSIDAPHTGRCNILAQADGLLRYAPEALITLNMVDERLTLAMLPPLTPVKTGDLVGTVKIIPFAVPQAALMACQNAWPDGETAAIAPFGGGRAYLLETSLPSVKPLSEKILSLTRQRATRVGLRLDDAAAAPHHPGSVANWLKATAKNAAPKDVILVFGASATVDKADVIPKAIEDAGGTLERVGMAADPGNLLVYGWVQGICVIGLPGCAKSPALNGFDWVLERTAAGIAISQRDWAAFSVGGLLKEIKTRPQPRRVSDPEQ